MAVLNGKIALVTGGSRGIGREIALQLGAAGAHVIVHFGAQREAAETCLAELVAAGGSGEVLGADLRTLAGVNDLMDAVEVILDGRGLDILINNAGVGIGGTVDTSEEPDFDLMFAVNVKAPLFLVKRAFPLMGQGGRIINLSSEAALGAHPEAVAYSASKGALNAMTISIAPDAGRRGITVNAIAPGATNTDFIAEYAGNPEAWKALENLSPFGRLGSTTDIAALACFLASPDAGWITGQIIAASGGAYL